MKLMTQEIRKNTPRLHATEDIKLEDKIVTAKFFTPWSHWTWYLIEFDGEDTCFGLVEGLEREFGYFRLSELESIKGQFGLRVERDRCFKPTQVSQLPR